MINHRNMNLKWTKLPPYLAVFALFITLINSQLVWADSVQSLEVIQLEQDLNANTDERWLTVKQAVLGDIDIQDGAHLMALETPERAYDGANVPISVTSLQEQTGKQYIKELYIIADKNPAPVAGKFYFQPDTGWQNLETRIRINEYTFVRAIAVTNDDQAYMISRFVKASGGCSTPAVGAPMTLDEASAESSSAGKFKFKLESSPIEKSEDERLQVNVQIQHPNHTGMQYDQLSLIYIPAYFIHTIGVKYDGKEIIKLETNFSLSENPSLRFDFIPEKLGGSIDIYAVDSKLKLFEQEWSS